MERIKQKMEEARMQRAVLQQRHPKTGVPEKSGSATSSAGTNSPMTLLESGLRRYGGATVITAAILFSLWLGFANKQDESPPVSPAPGMEQGIDEAGNNLLVDATTEKLEAHIKALNARLTSLAESVSELESRLTNTTAITNSLIGKVQKVAANPAIEKGERAPAGNTAATRITAADRLQASPEKTAHKSKAPPGNAANTISMKDDTLADVPAITASGATTAAKHETTPVSARQPPTGEPEKITPRVQAAYVKPDTAEQPSTGSSAPDNPWVINLASSPSKADADRFAARASTRGIDTELLQVTVKGKQYWRVQITGFPSREAAKAYAGTAREKLGLKDVWITKR